MASAVINQTSYSTLGWVDFLQKYASYCGNLGMTHKDEKWQKLCSKIYARLRVHTPIFGPKCPYRFVQCPDGRVLKGLHWKTALKRLLEGPKVFQIFFYLLEHVFGRFSNITTFETYYLDIVHIYRGISGQK